MYVLDERTGKQRYMSEYERADSERWVWWVIIAWIVGVTVAGLLSG